MPRARRAPALPTALIPRAKRHRRSLIRWNGPCYAEPCVVVTRTPRIQPLPEVVTEHTCHGRLTTGSDPLGSTRSAIEAVETARIDRQAPVEARVRD